MYPNWLSSGSITAWREAERFYAEDFDFLFDNTSLCCLCVCILLPYSFSFHITAMLYWIWLRVVYCSSARFYSILHLVYVRVKYIEQFLTWVLNSSCVFTHFRAFRVHDMMHKVILSRLEELSFGLVPMTNYSNYERTARRLSIQKNVNTHL